MILFSLLLLLHPPFVLLGRRDGSVESSTRQFNPINHRQHRRQETKGVLFVSFPSNNYHDQDFRPRPFLSASNGRPFGFFDVFFLHHLFLETSGLSSFFFSFVFSSPLISPRLQPPTLWIFYSTFGSSGLVVAEVRFCFFCGRCQAGYVMSDRDAMGWDGDVFR